jgi:DNA-binding IclR family transcriptional regulator
MTRALGNSPRNRSLTRGIELLRAFRQGTTSLGNAELAERAALPKSTVTRLAQTLVDAGLLMFEPHSGAYCLSPAVLGFAHAMRTGSQVLTIARPFMRAAAESNRINVGLAYPDRNDMVYLESYRFQARRSLRTVVSGQHIPVELTSLGRAYLATLNKQELQLQFASLRTKHSNTWPTVRAHILASIEQVHTVGYCAVSWQGDVIAVASTVASRGTSYALNASVMSSEPFEKVVDILSQILLEVRGDIQEALDAASPL